MKLPDPRSSRAVLIGTSTYDHLPQLPAVSNNVLALQEALCDEDIWGLPAENCITVTEPGTSIEMLDPVVDAAESAERVLLVYYAGHGLLGGSADLSLALRGTRDDPARLFSAVDYSALRNILQSSCAQYNVVILDCCYSGKVIGRMAAADVGQHADIEGSFILTATAPSKPAHADEGAEFTAFSNELITVLRDGIPNGESTLNLNAIYRHIYASLNAKGKPTPRSRGNNVAAEIPFFRNRASASTKHPQGYGEIPDTQEGQHFPTRRDLSRAGVHRALQAGIVGTQAAGGAESIVSSGGYVDDLDEGDTIIYTGHGGRDERGRQHKDQEPTDSGNAALLMNIASGLPVRVIRGAQKGNPHAPEEGYRYDGLYAVEEYWTNRGQDGFLVLQFRLEKIYDDESRAPFYRATGPGSLDPYGRSHSASGGDRRTAEKVKKAHDHACQVCGETLRTPSGFKWAQTVHLQSIGIPHYGPDIPANIICVCPTHQVQIQMGMLTINDDHSVVDESTGEPFTDLASARGHRVGSEYIKFHRELYRGRATSDFTSF